MTTDDTAPVAQGGGREMKEDNSTAGAVSAGTGSGEVTQHKRGWPPANHNPDFPWRVDPNHPALVYCDNALGTLVARCGGGGFEYTGWTREQCEATAAFIVRACNAHDELVARLEATLHTLGLMADAFPLGSATRNTLEEECAAIRAATAKATAPVDEVEEQGLAVTSEGTP